MEDFQVTRRISGQFISSMYSSIMREHTCTLVPNAGFTDLSGIIFFLRNSESREDLVGVATCVYRGDLTVFSKKLFVMGLLPVQFMS